MNAKSSDLKKFSDFKHQRSMVQIAYFINALQNIYKKHGTRKSFNREDMKEGIANFRKVFFELSHPSRTKKHVSNPGENSAAKRYPKMDGPKG